MSEQWVEIMVWAGMASGIIAGAALILLVAGAIDIAYRIWRMVSYARDTGATITVIRR